MDLFTFLKAHGSISIDILHQARDDSAIAKKSLFQTIYGDVQGLKYGVPFDRLSNLVQEYYKQEGNTLEVITSTAGTTCNGEMFKRFPTPMADLSLFFIPIVSKGVNYALTTKPDVEEFCNVIRNAYDSQSYHIAVCSPRMWDSFRALFVEPLLIASMAKEVVEKDPNASTGTSVSNDSLARKIYMKIINIGIQRRASDVHFIPCTNHCDVIFRIDGINHYYTQIPKDMSVRICNILKNDGPISDTTPNHPLDGKVRYSPSQKKTPGDEIDLRVSVIPSKSGPDINIRYLSDRLYSFDEIGMTADNIQRYKDILDLPSGLVVQVGPVGSGKSTTLYAGLNYIHSTLRNIITVEDPVEILMDGISQIDVLSGGKNPLTFADALKACLRHDPDVVVVGELRDQPTAFEAIRAANTGHLVLSSLHTNDSIGTFERLMNLGIDSYSLGEVIAAVMSQRLVRRLCPYCKEAYILHDGAPEYGMYNLPASLAPLKLYKAVGCPHCNNTGYNGRIAINEILVVDPVLRNIVQRHAVRSKIEEHLRNIEFRTMYHDGIDKVLSGVTSLAEIDKFNRDIIAFKG